MLRFLKNVDELQLDIVGFLAILGEGSVLSNAQVATLSKLSFLPRLMPAPQALLRPSRPSELEPVRGVVTGVESGNIRLNVNHIGHLLVDPDSMPDHSVRCIEILRTRDAFVKAKTKGPLSALALGGCVCSIALLVLSVVYKDGMALLAILLLSFLSSLLGISNKWQLNLPKRFAKDFKVPRADLVIRYPKGAFVIIQCTEDVARELFFAPENIEYFVSHPPIYRLISLIGTLMLMFGVIMLGNASIRLQISFGAAYLLMNAAYWIVAALPAKVHWDTSCFEIRKQRLESSTDNKYYTDENDTFMEALWKAILVTKSINWVKSSQAAPSTPAWNSWLDEALDMALRADSYHDEKRGNILVWRVPDWKPRKAYKRISNPSDPSNCA